MDSKKLLSALEKNPKAKGSELPQDEAQIWLACLSKAIGMEVALKHDQCFISEVIRNIQKSDFIAQIGNWDPFESDYGDGPPDVLDRWRKGKKLTNGLFNGSVFIDEKPFDKLSAEILSLFTPDGVTIILSQDLPLIIKQAKLWNAPRPTIEREAALINEIMAKVGKLSSESRRNLYVLLNKAQEVQEAR